LTAKNTALLVISIVCLAAVALGMLTVGTVFIPFNLICSTLLHALTDTQNTDILNSTELIILHIRWQRIALALLVGSGLSISGACFQTMF
jgi:iron complex transport system permease protein